MCNTKQSKELSDDELWSKAGTNQPITRDEMGIGSATRNDALQVLKEGFDISSLLNLKEHEDE